MSTHTRQVYTYTPLVQCGLSLPLDPFLHFLRGLPKVLLDQTNLEVPLHPADSNQSLIRNCHPESQTKPSIFTARKHRSKQDGTLTCLFTFIKLNQSSFLTFSPVGPESPASPGGPTSPCRKVGNTRLQMKSSLQNKIN